MNSIDVLQTPAGSQPYEVLDTEGSCDYTQNTVVKELRSNNNNSPATKKRKLNQRTSFENSSFQSASFEESSFAGGNNDLINGNEIDYLRNNMLLSY